MSASNNIKTDIMDKLSALPAMNKVYSFEKMNPDGFPCAFVTFTGNDNDFFTTAENKRVYGFRIAIAAQIGQDLNDVDKNELAEQTIQELIGEAIDAFDHDITLGNNAQVVFVESAVGESGYTEMEGGWVRMGTVNLKVHSLFLV